MRRRPGLTLVELLAVIAIIGLLLSLLVPAVQRAREAARRASCVNNLRQLALGILNYEHSNGCFPPGATADGSFTNPSTLSKAGPNWAVLILPYMEMAPLFDASADAITAFVGNAMSNPPRTGSATDWITAKNIVSQPIAAHLCPSDFGNSKFWSHTSAPGGATISWARGNYGANAGPGYYDLGTASPTVPGTFNYPIVRSGSGSTADPYVFREAVALRENGYAAPGPGVAFNAGWVMGVNSRIQTGHLRDGASTTVMIGELRISAFDLRGTWALGLPGASLAAGSGRVDSPGPNIGIVGGDDIPDCTPSNVGQPEIGMGCHNQSASQVTLKSMHSGGVQAAFCDGSVRWIADSISRVNYFRIHARCDGALQPASLDE